MALLDALLVVRAPGAPSPLLDLHRADAIPRAPHESDASDDVRPDEAADAAIPALADAPYAEKLVALALDGRVRTAEALLPRVLPPEVEALCIPGAGPSAA